MERISVAISARRARISSIVMRGVASLLSCSVQLFCLLPNKFEQPEPSLTCRARQSRRGARLGGVVGVFVPLAGVRTLYRGYGGGLSGQIFVALLSVDLDAVLLRRGLDLR